MTFPNCIAFDLDGVLLDLFTVIRRVCKERGDCILMNGTYDIVTENGADHKELWDMIAEAYERTDELKAIPGAWEVILKVFEMTSAPIQIVTARPEWSATHTMLAIDKKLPPVPYSISFSKNGAKSKLDYLYNYSMFVEDRRRTAQHLAQAGKAVFLLDTPYNQMDPCTGVVRLKTMYELLEHLDGGVVNVKEVR